MTKPRRSEYIAPDLKRQRVAAILVRLHDAAWYGREVITMMCHGCGQMADCRIAYTGMRCLHWGACIDCRALRSAP